MHSYSPDMVNLCFLEGNYFPRGRMQYFGLVGLWSINGLHDSVEEHLSSDSAVASSNSRSCHTFPFFYMCISLFMSIRPSLLSLLQMSVHSCTYVDKTKSIYEHVIFVIYIYNVFTSINAFAGVKESETYSLL